MPDSNGSVSDVNAANTPVRLPHRPAPPVPASPSISRKKQRHQDLEEVGREDPDRIDAESIYSVDSKAVNNETSQDANSRRRSKNRHVVTKRTLRQRKIHSLKRQIQIKEKMLEVSNGMEVHFR